MIILTQIIDMIYVDVVCSSMRLRWYDMNWREYLTVILIYFYNSADWST